MGVVRIEGKEVTLDDDIINAGESAIKAVLAANGFPAVENAQIEILGREKPGAPLVVKATPRSTGKGGITCAPFIEALAAAPEYVNPAIALAVEAMSAEAEGDTEFLDRAARSGAIERAVAEGSREGKEVMRALALFGHCVPASSKDVPVGF